jgi:hypothetical protein
MIFDLTRRSRSRVGRGDRRAARRQRRRTEAAHRTMLDRNPQSPTVALVGITQATGVLTFDFAPR